MNAYKLGSVYTFLMNRKKLELQPHEPATMAKNSVFSNKVILQKKKGT